MIHILLMHLMPEMHYTAACMCVCVYVCMCVGVAGWYTVYRHLLLLVSLLVLLHGIPTGPG